MNISFLKKSLVREFDSVASEKKTNSIRFFCKSGKKFVEVKICKYKIHVEYSLETETRAFKVSREEKPNSLEKYAEILCILSRYLCIETLCDDDSFTKIFAMKLPVEFFYEFLSENLFCLAEREFCLTKKSPRIITNVDLVQIDVDANKKTLTIYQPEKPPLKVTLNYLNLLKIQGWSRSFGEYSFETWLSEENVNVYFDDAGPSERMEFPERWRSPKRHLSHEERFKIVEAHRATLPTTDPLCDNYFSNFATRIIPVLNKSESPIAISVREEIYAQISARLFEAGYDLTFRTMETEESTSRKIYHLELSWGF